MNAQDHNSDASEKVGKYLEAHGQNCINCGSWEISGGPVEIDGGIAYQEITCNECGAEWDDIYTLTGIDNLIIPEKETENVAG